MRKILIITLLLATSWSANSNWFSPFSVGEYDESRVENGTTLFSYNYNKKSPRMIEVNMMEMWFGNTTFQKVCCKEAAY